MTNCAPSIDAKSSPHLFAENMLLIMRRPPILSQLIQSLPRLSQQLSCERRASKFAFCCFESHMRKLVVSTLRRLKESCRYAAHRAAVVRTIGAGDWPYRSLIRRLVDAYVYAQTPARRSIGPRA